MRRPDQFPSVKAVAKTAVTVHRSQETEMKTMIHPFAGRLVAVAAMLAACAFSTVALSQGLTYPVPGKPITILIPFAAGGPTDVGTRIVVPFLEKELGPGTTIQVVNKPGAGTQIANTELARSKPDGYTLEVVPPPSISSTYLDPSRGATYSRKDFTPIAHFTSEANLLVVPGSSPYRTVEEFLAAARAKPKTLKVGDVGLLGNTHLAGIAIEEAAKVRFAFVHFNGASTLATAMLGGNLDGAVTGILATMPHERAGTMRVLATLDNKRTKFFPNAAPLIEQGYNVYSPTSFAFFGPANMPKDIVNKLAEAIKRAMDYDEFKTKIQEVTLTPDYLAPEDLDKFWTEAEKRMSELLQMAKQRQE